MLYFSGHLYVHISCRICNCAYDINQVNIFLCFVIWLKNMFAAVGENYNTRCVHSELCRAKVTLLLLEYNSELLLTFLSMNELNQIKF